MDCISRVAFKSLIPSHMCIFFWLGPQDSTTMFAEEVTMRFIHADQTEEDAEEEDEQMTRIKRQFEYFAFFQGFNGGDGDKSSTMRPLGASMVRQYLILYKNGT